MMNIKEWKTMLTGHFQYYTIVMKNQVVGKIVAMMTKMKKVKKVNKIIK